MTHCAPGRQSVGCGPGSDTGANKAL